MSPIDPYVVPGDPASGLLAGISADLPAAPGTGDHRIQAFNFRVCLTTAADRLPFPRPPAYDPDRYALLLRYIEAGIFDVLGNNQPMPNGKTDLNNNGAVATDNIGANYGWPDGDYRERERIFQDHVTYQQGMLWFLANDERVPTSIREQMRRFGLPRDEFPDTGGWPHELYIREARPTRLGPRDDRARLPREPRRARLDRARLVHDGLAQLRSAWLCDGHPRNEGDVQAGTPAPYPIAYRSIVPRAGECANLLVPVCLSASHIAYGSIRMEPVFMLLGQAAATAAAQAIDAGVAVQDVEYAALRRQLLRDGMVLQWPPPAGGLMIDAPELQPDAPGTVTVTLRNDDAEAYEDVEIVLGEPRSFGLVPPGTSVEAEWELAFPEQTEPAAAVELRARATYTVAGSAAEQEAVGAAYVVEPVAAPYATFANTEAHFGTRGDRLAIIAGGKDIWVDIDQYGALYRPGGAGPDTVVVTRLVSQDPTDPNARAGLVMRNDLRRPGESAGYVVLVAKPQNGFLLLWDADGDGYVESVARAGGPVTPYPVWLRLARSGTTFTGSYSTDGAPGLAVGSAVVLTAAAVQDVGVLCCSHAAALGRVVFDGFETAAG